MAYYLSLGSLHFRGVASQQGHRDHEIQNCKHCVQPKQLITAKTSYKIQFKYTHREIISHMRIDTYGTYLCLRFPMVVLPKLYGSLPRTQLYKSVFLPSAETETNV